MEPVAKRERTGLLILPPKELNPKMTTPKCAGRGAEKKVGWPKYFCRSPQLGIVAGGPSRQAGVSYVGNRRRV